MNKISADQLAKRACVYIRQSTPGQVQNNLESQRLQYAMVDRARQLGWAEVDVVDEDLGCTASGIHRPGFERMLGSVCEGAYVDLDWMCGCARSNRLEFCRWS